MMLANAPADFVLHNSQFLIAHFHNTIIGGTVFGASRASLTGFRNVRLSAQREAGQERYAGSWASI